MENPGNQPIQEVPSQTPVEQPIAEPEKSSILRSKWLKIGGILVVLLLLLGGTYFLGKESSKSTPAPIVQSPAPTLSPTADWLTYHGLDYSFDYPNNWAVSQNKITCETKASQLCNIVEIKDPSQNITIKIAPGNLVFSSEGQTEKGNDSFITIDGQKFEGNEIIYLGATNGSFIRNTFQVANNNIWEIAIETKEGQASIDDYKKEIGTIEKMLSSISYTTDQIATPTPNPTANWKTLSGTGFEIKYPSDLYETTTGNGIFTLEPTSSFNDSKPLAVTYYISIAPFTKKSGMTMNDPYSLFGNGVALQYTKDLITGKPIANTTLGGQSALRIDNIPAGQAGDGSEIYTITGNTVYEIVISPRQVTGDSEKNKSLIDQILSTFRFD